MKNKFDLLCAWTGPMMIISFLIGWVFLAQWLPPPSPNFSAEQIANVYKENTIGIRTGMMLMMYGSALNIPFAAVIMTFMLRMKNASTSLAYTQFGAGAVNVLFFLLPAQMFGAVAFRPERMADITLYGNDLAWMTFGMPNSPTILQWVSLGLAILCDESPRPIFPRWFAYFSFWASLLVVTPGLITYFKTGPFAWDGFFGFYVGLVVFCAWYGTMFVVLQKAIKEHS